MPGFTYDDPVADDPIRALYRVGDAILIRDATPERLPTMVRYIASRLRRVARYHAAMIERRRNDAPDSDRPGVTLDRAAQLLMDAIARLPHESLVGATRDTQALAPISFLYVSALEGLLDEPIYARPDDPVRLMIEYIASDVTLAHLEQKVGLSPDWISSQISATIADTWNRLPASRSDDFPFDPEEDFPLWKLRRFRMLKHAGHALVARM